MDKYKNLSIALFLILNLSAIIFFVYQINSPKPKDRTEKVLPAQTSKGGVETRDISQGDESYIISYKKIDSTDDLKLIPNYSDPKTSDQVNETYDCKFLTNGGFYLTETNLLDVRENMPIGLFIHDFEKLSDFQKNKTLNGILSINDFGTPRITQLVPSGSLQDAVQSGPLLKENGSYREIKMSTDSKSRRMLAAITGANELYFLTIYKKDVVSAGPELSEISGIMEIFENTSNIHFADILNLDGGSASVFIGDSVLLPESRLAGSFFCLTDQ